ncbi:MAG: hypothetical protein IKE66_04570 [Hyphomicrobium sp.]|nr:hypothetical protein [Hyphomicrobium sp.]
MTTQHSEVFYYAIAVYAIGAAAVVALPSGSQPQTEAASQLTSPLASGHTANAETAAKVTLAAATPTAVRNSVSARSSGFVFAGTPAKF